MRNKLKKGIPAHIYGELVVIILVFWLFYVSAAISGMQYQTNETAMLIKLMASTILLLTALFQYVRKTQFGVRIGIRKWYDFVKTKKEILVVLCLNLIFRLGYLGTTPRWDSEIYLKAIMNACKNYDFTIASYLQYFRLCSHTTLGYSIFAAIGEYLAPEWVYGINVINLILFLFATYFLYRILEMFLSHVSKGMLALAVLVITSEPLMLGTFGNINIDFPVMVFTIFIIYMHMRKYYLLFFFFAVILAQSKETGCVVLAGYSLAYFLFIWKKNKRKALENPILWGLELTWVGVIIYFLLLGENGIRLWAGGINIGDKQEGIIHYFSIVPEYISLKMKMIFGMNFYWLFSLITVCLLLVLLYDKWQKRRIKHRKNLYINRCEHKEVVASLCGSATAMLVFNCIYVTWSNPRYHYFLAWWLLFVTVMLILTVIQNTWFQKGLFLLMLICCLAQSYTTVDYMTKKLFGNQWTGANYTVAHPAWNAQKKEYLPESVLADMAVYNNQMMFLDKAYNKFLREINYDGNQNIVIWDDLPQYNGFSATSINCYWDKGKKRRTFYKTPEAVPIRVITKKEYENVAVPKADTAYYLYTPSYGIQKEQALEQLQKYYEIKKENVIEIWEQGCIYYYKLEKKD